MSDLHGRLHAAITARRELAQAADREWAGIPAIEDVPDVVNHFVDANYPAQILRDTAADLRTLARHQPYKGNITCSWCVDRRTGQAWENPCPDYEDLTSRYPEATDGP